MAYPIGKSRIHFYLSSEVQDYVAGKESAERERKFVSDNSRNGMSWMF
jgi:hypothetical protein